MDSNVVHAVRRSLIFFYRLAIQLVANLPLTLKLKFCFGLAWPSQTKAELLI